MEETKITVCVYFKVLDAEIFGGAGTVGYSRAGSDFSFFGADNPELQKYVDDQIRTVANILEVPPEKVKTVSREEYEENAEED